MLTLPMRLKALILRHMLLLFLFGQTAKQSGLLVVHLVQLLNVRRVRGAADAVKMMVDTVRAQWQRWLLGMPSALDEGNADRREIETAIFDALRASERMGTDFKLVRADCAAEEKPSFPWTLGRRRGTES